MIKFCQTVLSICYLFQLSIYAYALDENSWLKTLNAETQDKHIHGSKLHLAADTGTKLESTGSFGYFGYDVSTGGDINGDGYSDVIVGSPYRASFRGSVYIYLGSPTGISTSASLVLDGPAEGSEFGNAVASAGDVNGDGFGDVIIGTKVSNNDGAPNIGSAYLHLGGRDGLSAAPASILLGTKTGFYGTTTLAGIGDVNGDGFSDVMVGRSEVIAKPEVFVFYGSGNGLSQEPSATIRKQEDNTALGNTMAGLGDVNGDGYGDVLIASFYNPSGTGSAHLHLGSAVGLSDIPATTLTGSSNSFFGCSISGAGDTNGDGFNDVIIGDYLYESSKGAVFIYLGNSSGISKTPATTLIGFSKYGSFGVSVASAGDQNADGYSDVLIGAGGYDYTVGTSNAYLFQGSKVGVIVTEFQNFLGPELRSAFGNSVSPAGDVNGDGRSDIIIGAFQSNMESGAAYVYLGETTPLSTTASTTFTEPVVSSIFTLTSSGVGDLNGDGFSDVAVAAFEHSDSKGIVYIYYGSLAGLPESPSVILEAPSRNSQFFGIVAAAGDVNGDGYGDLIVGDRSFNNNHGAAYIYLGSSAGITVTPATILTDQFLQTFTYAIAVAGAGDVNGDGYSDVIIGDPIGNKVFVHMGSASGTVSAAAVTLTGSGGKFGSSIANAGDVNGDGYNDIIIGEHERDFSRGAAYVYYGSSTGLSLTNMTMLDGVSANNHFGIAVSSAGDINGDGYSDVIVGASIANTVTVFSGGPEGITPSRASELTGPLNYSSFGHSLASAGDVNGDGYGDVVVGAYQTDGGFAYVYLGREKGLSAEPKVTLHGVASAIGFGVFVAGAGDVNGDGYSDILSTSFLVASNQLSSQLFNGNNQGTHNNVLKLYNADLSNPIGQLNLQQDLFGIGLFVKPFAGTAQARLVWETKPNGQPFNSSSPITNYTGYSGSDDVWTTIPHTGIELKVLVSKAVGRTTKLRVRVQYRSSVLPFGQVFGPWVYPQDYSNGVLGQKGSPLPVSLTYFAVKAEEAMSRLEWGTSWESNSKIFEIEHSVDGRGWDTIGFVDAIQNSSHVSKYEFGHSTPLLGDNLYRLKMVDNDGSFTYSKIRHLLFQKSEFLIVYPNPTTDLIKVKVPGQNKSGDIKSLNIFNSVGENVSCTYRIINEELHISGLPDGIYVFSAVIGSGQSFKGKFWVHH